MSDSEISFLRHALATLAYRANRAIRNAPPEFAAYRAAETTRTPAEILAHVGDLMDWGVSIADGKQRWKDSKPLPWDQEVARFFTALEQFDTRLASPIPIACSVEKL